MASPHDSSLRDRPTATREGSSPGGADGILAAVAKNILDAERREDDDDDPIFKRSLTTTTTTTSTTTAPKKKEYVPLASLNASAVVVAPPSSSAAGRAEGDERRRRREEEEDDGDYEASRRRRARSGSAEGRGRQRRHDSRDRSVSRERSGGGGYRHHRDRRGGRGERSRSPHSRRRRRSRESSSRGNRRRRGSDASSTGSAGSKRRVRPDSHDNEKDVAAKAKGPPPTLVISQLQTKTRKEDVERFFVDRLGCPVRTVEIVRDGVTGRCKGSAYVELRKEEDMAKAVARSGEAFIWPDGSQGFPVLIKSVLGGEEGGNGNYGGGGVFGGGDLNGSLGGGSVTGHFPPSSSSLASSVYGSGLRVANEVELKRRNETVVKAEVVDRAARAAKVVLRDDMTRFEIEIVVPMTSKGEIVVSSWLRITLSPTAAGSVSVSYAEVAEKISLILASKKYGEYKNLHHFVEKGYTLVEMDGTEATSKVMAGLSYSSGDGSLPELLVEPIPEHAAMIARGRHAPSLVPTRRLCVFPCFDPRQETETGWWNEVERDIAEECNNSFGPVMVCKVDRINYEGRVYVVFRSVEDAVKAAQGLNGRFFGGRQLHVEFEM